MVCTLIFLATTVNYVDRQVIGFLKPTLQQEFGWSEMDYADIVVHVFYEPVREFYDIERLWSDAPKMEVAEDTAEVKSLPRGM